MANAMSSLSAYLKQPNPKIINEHSWEGSNTRSANDSWEDPDHIDKWDDFEYKFISRLFYDKLQTEVEHLELPDINGLPFHLTEIHDEDSLEALLVRWTNAVVSTALAVAQYGHTSTNPDTSPDTDQIFMARGGQGWIPDTNMTRKSCRPDWAGIQANNPVDVTVNGQKRRSYHNILPGDSKLSSKWRIKTFKKDEDRAKFRDPLKQIFTYCLRANARYGYLITQDELVVVRLSYREKMVDEDSDNSSSEPLFPQRRLTRKIMKDQQKAEISLPEGAKKRKANRYERVLEYQKVSWAAGGRRNPKVLTINLALWSLHMMAKQDGPLVKVGNEQLLERLDTSFIGDTQESTSVGSGRALKKRKGANRSFRSDASMRDQ